MQIGADANASQHGAHQHHHHHNSHGIGTDPAQRTKVSQMVWTTQTHLAHRQPYNVWWVAKTALSMATPTTFGGWPKPLCACQARALKLKQGAVLQRSESRGRIQTQTEGHTVD
jgi:hypothetical protein